MSWMREMHTVTPPKLDQQRFRLFLFTLIMFMITIPVLLWSIERLSIRGYFILCFIWFLVTSEIFAPTEPETLWWKRLKWLKAAGWLILVYIVGERVAAVI